MTKSTTRLARQILVNNAYSMSTVKFEVKWEVKSEVELEAKPVLEPLVESPFKSGVHSGLEFEVQPIKSRT